jgi:hypothetical protein
LLEDVSQSHIRSMQVTSPATPATCLLILPKDSLLKISFTRCFPLLYRIHQSELTAFESENKLLINQRTNRLLAHYGAGPSPINLFENSAVKGAQNGASHAGKIPQGSVSLPYNLCPVLFLCLCARDMTCKLQLSPCVLLRHHSLSGD